MDKTPLVSIIMPIYNMEQYLSETLDSILASDYPNFEVIAVDDGSKDNSLQIAQEYAAKDSRLRVLAQSNSGVCTARNYAIRESNGVFILPVDSDDIITPDFVSLAVAKILSDKSIKVVTPKSNFMGTKSGEWRLPEFSLNLLARKNIICVTALYYKSEWVRVGGYCNTLIAREDWDFWISMLKSGGKVVRLDKVTFYYRRRAGSKRITDRKFHKHLIDTLNERHAEFFERELGGKLHYARSWSKVINKFQSFWRNGS